MHPSLNDFTATTPQPPYWQGEDQDQALVDLCARRSADWWRPSVSSGVLLLANRGSAHPKQQIAGSSGIL